MKILGDGRKSRELARRIEDEAIGDRRLDTRGQSETNDDLISPEWVQSGTDELHHSRKEEWLQRRHGEVSDAAVTPCYKG